MKTFESKLIVIAKSKQEIFTFLSDFRNFEKIMPKEVSKWSAQEGSCSFTISNMAELNMKFGDCVEFSNINIISSGRNPFNYNLKLNIIEIDSNSSQFSAIFEADLNPMIAMMASRPLTNFVDTLGDKLQEVLS